MIEETAITFTKLELKHVDTILHWLIEPHIIEFWDNTQAHKDDIINFACRRKIPSSYADGMYKYFVASFEHEPFAMFMIIQEIHKEDIGWEKLERLSKTGNTYSLDYMIGNINFLGCGYGANTLVRFIEYFRSYIDLKADTFLIDPVSSNPRAKHVYMKAGFEHVCDFIMEGCVSGAGKLHNLLVKKFEPMISIIKATKDDYTVIANMCRFYAYDLSRWCASISDNWDFPDSGMYESFDPKIYFEDEGRHAYTIRVYNELAGFVLLNQATENSENNWNMGEFFIIAKFQGQGIGSLVAQSIWNMHPGKWEVSVIPNNKPALKFWEKTISKFTNGSFNKQIKEISYDEHCPRRVIFEFDIQNIKIK